MKSCYHDLQKKLITPFYVVSVFPFEGLRSTYSEKSPHLQRPEAEQDGRPRAGPPLGVGGIDQIRNVIFYAMA